jgi:hypothetical protein
MINTGNFQIGKCTNSRSPGLFQILTFFVVNFYVPILVDIFVFYPTCYQDDTMDLPVQSEDVQVGLETQDIIMPTVNTLINQLCQINITNC